MRSRKAVQRSTWRSWKPSGRPRSCEPLGLPVDLGQQGDAVDQLEGQARRRLEVGVERLGPAVRRPWATSRRRTPSGRRSGPAPRGRRTRRGPAVWGTSVPSSASMIRHSRSDARRRGRRAPSGGGMRRAPCEVRPAGSRRSRSGVPAGDEGASIGAPRRAVRAVQTPGGRGRQLGSRAGVDVGRRLGRSITGCPPRARGTSANLAWARGQLLGQVLGRPQVVARPGSRAGPGGPR